MDYEKAYKELIEKLRKAKDDYDVCDDRYCVVIDSLVPELAEIEDERIGNLIYCLIRDRSDNQKLLEHNGVSVDKALAYLEKKKESLHISETCKENADSFTDEDERIRKALIGFIDKVHKDNNVLLLVADRIGDDIPNMIPSWIAYLERQKEPLTPEEKMNHPLYLEGFDVGKRVGLTLKEQKPLKLYDDTEVGLDRALQIVKDAKGNLGGYQSDDGIHECDHAIQTLERILKNGIEQKPAEWSEKDEARKERLISIVKRVLHGNEYCLLNDKGATELITWLNALYERLNLQPKQEWSKDEKQLLDSIIDDYEKASKSFCGYDGKIGLLKAIRNGEYDLPKKEWSKEDEDMLNSIIATCQLAAQDRDSGPARHLFEMQEKFLKSFRPQQKQDGVWITKEQFEQIKSASYLTGKLDHWKPTEKQMKGLLKAMTCTQFDYKTVESLYDDLKKLC